MCIAYSWKLEKTRSKQTRIRHFIKDDLFEISTDKESQVVSRRFTCTCLSENQQAGISICLSSYEFYFFTQVRVLNTSTDSKRQAVTMDYFSLLPTMRVLATSSLGISPAQFEEEFNLLVQFNTRRYRRSPQPWVEYKAEHQFWMIFCKCQSLAASYLLMTEQCERNLIDFLDMTQLPKKA